MLSRRFYARDAVTVARALLGQRLVSTVRDHHSDEQGGGRVAGTIVEVEAYLGVEDKAAHTYGGRYTARNASMWGPAGHAYVYFTYGMHHCVNVVAQGEGHPVAVLIRALEPTEGTAIMQRRRTAKRSASASKPSTRAQSAASGDLSRGVAGALPITQLCSGPAKLCEALGIDRSLDGVDLCDAAQGGGPLTIERARSRPIGRNLIATGPRVGVAYAEEWAEKPLRFALARNPHVSRPKPPEPRADATSR